jgi:hypothetical protein
LRKRNSIFQQMGNGASLKLSIYYHGNPVVQTTAMDGGWIFTKMPKAGHG